MAGMVRRLTEFESGGVLAVGRTSNAEFGSDLLCLCKEWVGRVGFGGGVGVAKGFSSTGGDALPVGTRFMEGALGGLGGGSSPVLFLKSLGGLGGAIGGENGFVSTGRLFDWRLVDNLGGLIGGCGVGLASLLFVEARFEGAVGEKGLVSTGILLADLLEVRCRGGFGGAVG